MTNEGKESRWDYDESELERARTRMNIEKGLLDTAKDNAETGFAYQEDQEGLEADFKEEEHPRDGGKFTDKGGAKKDTTKGHGRLTSGKGYDEKNKNTWGYHKEDLDTPEGRVQMIKNYFDKNPNKTFNPFESLPESITDKVHPNDFEQSAISLVNQGILKSTSGLGYKLRKKKGESYSALEEAPDDIDPIFGKAEEDWGESTQKCQECGKVFDVADNEGITSHVRQHRVEYGEDFEPSFIIESLAKEESSISVSGPPAGTQPPANMFDDEEEEAPIGEAGDFREEEHPRDGGKFTSKGGGDTGKKEGGSDSGGKGYWGGLSKDQKENILTRVGMRDAPSDTNYDDLPNDVKSIVDKRSKNAPKTDMDKKDLKTKKWASKQTQDKPKNLSSSDKPSPTNEKPMPYDKKDPAGLKNMSTQKLGDFTTFLDKRAVEYPKGSDVYKKTMKLRKEIENEYKKRLSGESHATEVEHEKCPQCNFETSWKEEDPWQELDAEQEMSSHIKDKHGESYTTEAKSEMELKHSDWGNTQPFWCMVCGAGGEDPEDIEAHYDLTGHGGKSGESKANENEGWWECETCSAIAIKEEDKQDHEQATGHTMYHASFQPVVPLFHEVRWNNLPRELKLKLNENFSRVTESDWDGSTDEEKKGILKEAGMYGYGSATGRMPPAEHWNQGLDAYGDMGYDSKLASPMYGDFSGMTWSEVPEDIQQAYLAKHDYIDTTQTEAQEDEPEALLTRLLNNELAEQEAGADEEEDIALVLQLMGEEEFKEGEHPREDTGKFTSKGGGVGKKAEKPKGKPHKGFDKAKTRAMRGMKKPDASDTYQTDKYNQVNNLDGFPTHSSQLRGAGVRVKAPIMKAHLKSLYPDNNWSVKTEYFSMGSAIRGGWKGGGKYPYGASKDVGELYSNSGASNMQVDYSDTDNYSEVHDMRADYFGGDGNHDQRDPQTIADSRQSRLRSWVQVDLRDADYQQQHNWSQSVADDLVEKGKFTPYVDMTDAHQAQINKTWKEFQEMEVKEGGAGEVPKKEVPKATTPAFHTQQYMADDPKKPTEIPIDPSTGAELPVSKYNPRKGEYPVSDPTSETPEDVDRAHKQMLSQKKSDKGEPWQRKGESLKKKLTEFEDSDRGVSPSALNRYSEPIDLPNGKNALDQTYGVSEPETPDGQDLTGKTIGEDIKEKKPFKPTYLYYKQYPFGRRAGKQNPFGEANEAVYEDIKEQIKNSGISYGYNRDELINYLKNLGYYDEDILNAFNRFYGEATEVDIDTMNQAHIWWDNKYPERQWSDMRIGERQNAILAFLRDPTTTLNEAYAKEQLSENVWDSLSESQRLGEMNSLGWSSDATQEMMEHWATLDWRELKNVTFSWAHIRNDLGESKANEWLFDPQEDVDYARIRELEDKVRDKTATLPEHNEIVDLLRDYVPMDDPDISLPYSTPESHPHYYESYAKEARWACNDCDRTFDNVSAWEEHGEYHDIKVNTDEPAPVDEWGLNEPSLGFKESYASEGYLGDVEELSDEELKTEMKDAYNGFDSTGYGGDTVMQLRQELRRRGITGYIGESKANEYSTLSSWSIDEIINKLDDDRQALNSTGEWSINASIDELKDELTRRGYVWNPQKGEYAKEGGQGSGQKGHTTFDPLNDPVPTNNTGEENPFLRDVKRKAKGQLSGFGDKGTGAKQGITRDKAKIPTGKGMYPKAVGEGGQGSGRNKEPHHIGWKNYGIDDYLEQAMKDYEEKEAEEQAGAGGAGAGAGGAGGNGAGAPTGNGGTPPVVDGDGEPEEEEPSRRHGILYGYNRCPEGKVFRDGKCVEEAGEQSYADMSEDELEELGDMESSPHQADEATPEEARSLAVVEPSGVHGFEETMLIRCPFCNWNQSPDIGFNTEDEIYRNLADHIESEHRGGKWGDYTESYSGEGGSVECPNCGSTDMIYKTTTQQRHCKNCGNTYDVEFDGFKEKLTPTTGTWSKDIPSVYEADFREEEHPRDKGKFTTKGGGSSGTSDKTKAKKFFDSHDSKIGLLHDIRGVDGFSGYDADSYEDSFKKFAELDDSSQQEIIDHVKEKDRQQSKLDKDDKLQSRLYKLEPKTPSDTLLNDKWDLLSPDDRDDLMDELSDMHDMSDKGHPPVTSSISKIRDHYTSGFTDDEVEKSAKQDFNDFIDSRTPNPYDVDAMNFHNHENQVELERVEIRAKNSRKEYKNAERINKKLSKGSDYERKQGEDIKYRAYWTLQHDERKLQEQQNIKGFSISLRKNVLKKDYQAGEGGKGSGKRGHVGWMRAIEEEHTYDFCENCSMITEQVNHKCEMCGKKVIV